MNYRLIIRQLGLLVFGLSVVLLIIWLWSAIAISFSNSGSLAFLWSGGIACAMGFALFLLGKRGRKNGGTGADAIGRREALFLVSTSWLIGAVVSSLPFFIWARITHFQFDSSERHPFQSVVNCFFEAMSGLTTTGATILTDISTIPAPLLFWRSMIQWLGGLGIVVLFVAVLPSLGVGGKKLFKIEAPGPEPEGVRPHIRETARVLWLIYVSLTLVEIVAYKFAGLPLFDASCHALTTLATGGFSTQSASIGGYDSRIVSIITIVFMIIASTNFGLLYAAIRGRLRLVWQDTEFRCYIFLLAIGSAVIVCSLLGAGGDITTTTGATQPATIQNTLTHGVFTAVSIQTNTGFTTADYNTWPFVTKAVIVMMMFIGGCAGSTGGGIKIIRVWLAIRIMLSEVERAFRPNVVRPLKVGKNTVDSELKLATIAYVLGVVVLFSIGAGSLMVLESGNPNCDFTTAATASIATICTVGPGLAKVSPIESYIWFTDASKLFLCVMMAIGRLEIFAVLVLVSPRFWLSK
ncbi:MAG: TrkH family potassium uptake protein [Planctomycetota bacterium]|nr:TrkH family potassium uptake protein [Planctomycetota bacterium]